MIAQHYRTVVQNCSIAQNPTTATQRVFPNIFFVDKSLLDDLLKHFDDNWSTDTLESVVNATLDSTEGARPFHRYQVARKKKLAVSLVNGFLRSWMVPKLWLPLSFQVKSVLQSAELFKYAFIADQIATDATASPPQWDELPRLTETQFMEYWPRVIGMSLT